MCVGDDLSGGGSARPPGSGRSERPGEEPEPREDHRLRPGASARHRRDRVSRRWREGEAVPKPWEPPLPRITGVCFWN